MKKPSNKSRESKKLPKVKVSKLSTVNASSQRGLIPLSAKKSSVVRVALTNAAAVGGVIPVNLKVGRNFGKSDKVMIAIQCCGPHVSCHCGKSFHVA